MTVPPCSPAGARNQRDDQYLFSGACASTKCIRQDRDTGRLVALALIGAFLFLATRGSSSDALQQHWSRRRRRSTIGATPAPHLNRVALDTGEIRPRAMTGRLTRADKGADDIGWCDLAHP